MTQSQHKFVLNDLCVNKYFFRKKFDGTLEMSDESDTVESRISGTQNSGKSRISGQFLNDQLVIDRIE